jgi:predicted DNA-binding transcriptional regulator AlpA
MRTYGDSIMEKLFYNIGEVATLLGTTVSAIQAHIARKNFDAVPPPARLGKRLAWPVPEVNAWFSRKIAETHTHARFINSSASEEQKRGRGRPRKSF